MDFHRYTFRAQKYRSSLFRLRTRKCTLSPVETQDRNVLYRADTARGHARGDTRAHTANVHTKSAEIGGIRMVLRGMASAERVVRT